MDWISVGTGAIITAFIFALISQDDEQDLEYETDNIDDYEITDFQSRHVILSCQTCRKLKKHREIEPNLYQCSKCKRHTDLRK